MSRGDAIGPCSFMELKTLAMVSLLSLPSGKLFLGMIPMAALITSGGSLDRHVGVLDLRVILVGHLAQVRINIVEALLVSLEDQIVVVLIHLSNIVA